MVAGERLQLGDDLRVVAESELTVEELLERGQPQLLEVSRRPLRELLPEEVGECGTAPQFQCRAVGAACGCVVTGGDGTACRPDEPLELLGVDLGWLDAQDVAAPTGHEAGAGLLDARARQRLTHMGDVALDGGGRRGRGAIRPEGLDERVDRYDAVRAEHQDRERGPLLLASNRHPGVSADDLERTEYSELEAGSRSEAGISAGHDSHAAEALPTLASFERSSVP